MSKYVKEMMMDQLRSDLDGSRSLLILDLKDLDANSEFQLRRDLRKKSIRLRALKNSLARRVFTDLGMDGLSKYLEGPSVAAWGGDGVAELAKDVVRNVARILRCEVDANPLGPDQPDDLLDLLQQNARDVREQKVGFVEHENQLRFGQVTDLRQAFVKVRQQP